MDEGANPPRERSAPSEYSVSLLRSLNYKLAVVVIPPHRFDSRKCEQLIELSVVRCQVRLRRPFPHWIPSEVHSSPEMLRAREGSEMGHAT